MEVHDFVIPFFYSGSSHTVVVTQSPSLLSVFIGKKISFENRQVLLLQPAVAAQRRLLREGACAFLLVQLPLGDRVGSTHSRQRVTSRAPC